MRPNITFLTSSELQKTLGKELTEDQMQRLRSHRDAVQDMFTDHQRALDKMEVLYGQKWRQMDMKIWFFDANKSNISSPILLQKEDVEVDTFLAFQMLAKNLIRQNYPDSPLVAKGFDKIDAVATMLASEALRDVMDAQSYHDMIEEVKEDNEHIKIWRAADKLRDRWDPDRKHLYEWLEDYDG